MGALWTAILDPSTEKELSASGSRKCLHEKVGLILLAACFAVAEEGQPFGVTTFMWRSFWRL
jgi:hypothetical protein